jgi:precorrin-3B synthase
MESGDGLIVRLPAGSRGFAAGELRALCRLAEAHGNGLIEITRRANVQLRGIRAEALSELQRELVELGLASAADRRPASVLVNPLAGLAEAPAPLLPIGRAIEVALAGSDVLDRLSDKFGVIVDCRAELREIAADIRVELCDPRRAELHVDGAALALGSCALAEIGPAVTALARALAESGERRMRDLFAACGRAELLRSARLELEPALPPSAAGGGAAGMLGFGRGSRDWLGLALAFGSGTADQWRAVCELAERFGSGELRVTPFRTLIVPDVNERAGVRECVAAGWIVDARDPILRASACPGAPACRSAAAETRELARSLAPLLAADSRLHVSGCAKGCAHSGAADVTLVRAPSGVKLGFGLRAAEAAEEPVMDLETARARIQAHG